MAYGIITSIASNSHTQLLIPAGMQFPSLAILNPNDGVAYVAQDRDILNTNFGSWDWKCPSQSYALLPASPYWHSVGIFYLDQSGAGRTGEITIYPVNQKTTFPQFVAIGRALVAQQTSLDITEGAQPANPGSGILRVWADGSDVLHGLNGAGTDEQFISTRTALTGALTGSVLPSTSLPNFTMSGTSTSLVNVPLWTDIAGTQVALPAGLYYVVFTARYITGANLSNGQVGISNSSAGTGGTPSYVVSPQIAVPANSQREYVGTGIISIAAVTIKFQAFADATGCSVDSANASIVRIG